MGEVPLEEREALYSELEFFRSSSKDAIWQRYCGFLDLSIDEFMVVQERNLIDEIGLVSDSTLARTIMNGAKPETVAEFRKLVRLTTYDNYLPFLTREKEDILALKPYYWARTSGRDGAPKWVPFSLRADEVLHRNIIGAALLASSRKRGDINVWPGEKVLFNLPGRPFLTGWLAHSMNRHGLLRAVPPLEVADKMEFMERIEKGFNLALRHNVACIAALSSVLVKIGEGFQERTRGMKFTFSMMHPAVFLRMMLGQIKSRLIHRRELLPKDLWPVKAIIGWGSDTGVYRQQILHCWGQIPYEIYGTTEAGAIAMQSWPKKYMIFLADSVFLEFIPEADSIRSKDDPTYQPATLLLNEVEEGKIYEIVVTSFYGMPFLRYRPGDLVEIVALRDEVTGINLPQVLFHSRADDIIDIGGFTRLSEKVMWLALENTGIRYEDWTLRKEVVAGNPILHLYVEPKEAREPAEVERLFHDQLKQLDTDYGNVDSMLGLRPVRVTLLSEGTFRRYFEDKQRVGVELAHWKPPHMNASDTQIRELALSSQRRPG